jgi:hypothetical protein
MRASPQTIERMATDVRIAARVIRLKRLAEQTAQGYAACVQAPDARASRLLSIKLRRLGTTARPVANNAPAVILRG